MKKIGLIGGLGPEATQDYYKRIIEVVRGKTGSLDAPEIIIYSVNLQEALTILDAKDDAWLADWLLAKVEALAAAGAEFAAITANTAHLVFDRVAERSPLPLLSIVEATCAVAQTMGLKRGGLMGTRFTMQADFFQRAFARGGVELLVPNTAEQELIHHKLFSEIELGIIRDETREELLEIVRQMIDREGIDFLVLGCTELPLILPEEAFGIPLLNTTALHVDSIVAACLGRVAVQG